MTDDALVAWLESGCKVALPADEAASKQAQEFSLRFAQAVYVDDDLGPTCEEHEAAVARNVLAVHKELNALGEEAYSAVWRTLPAKSRAAIKRYVEIALKADR